MNTHVQTDVPAENAGLKAEFLNRGLNIEAIWFPTPDDLELENRQLRMILDWVRAYRAQPDRRALERAGYLYPPVDPDIDPDCDWLKFERWVTGRPVAWNYVAEFGPLMEPGAMNDRTCEEEFERIADLLEKRGILVEFEEKLPARAAYEALKREMESSSFEYMAEGTHLHLTGCTGGCETCFQRPWCGMAGDLAEEDAIVAP